MVEFIKMNNLFNPSDFFTKYFAGIMDAIAIHIIHCTTVLSSFIPPLTRATVKTSENILDPIFAHTTHGVQQEE